MSCTQRRKPKKTRRAGRPARFATEVVVVGAGAFGGWTALHLAEHGARVTLVDAWGAGHPRGTSSDESRILRCGYGAKHIYTAWAWRALDKWKQFERLTRTEVFVPSGVLWLCAGENDYVAASLAALRQNAIPVERLTLAELRRRFPQFSADGLAFAYFEPRSGVLRARLATMRVAEAVAGFGGRVVTAAAEPPAGPGPRARRIRLHTGEWLEAEHFVYACGPWLPQLFPALLGRRILCNKQEVFYFSPPAGETRFDAHQMPAWIETSSDCYGIPAVDARGVKVADDRSGPPFDPTQGERVASAEGLATVRRHLERRVPGMAGAPLAEARVCQYERTPDSHLVVDRHPDYQNVWLIGGGSGHGFKLGPSVGEFVAGHLLGVAREPIPPQLRLGASAWPAALETPPTRSF